MYLCERKTRKEQSADPDPYKIGNNFNFAGTETKESILQ
jgi:hypothetical protein